MEQEKPLDQQESIQLITEMIQKVKNHFHESGICAILWGSVVGIAGLVNFAELYWKFYIGFDIWLIVLAAVIPQIFISIKESKQRKMLTHTEAAMNAVWMIYGISIFALVFYLNIVPAVTRKELAIEGISLLQSNTDGSTKTFEFFIPSHGSLLLILYAIPTLASGIAYRFTPYDLGWRSNLYIFYHNMLYTECL